MNTFDRANDALRHDLAAYSRALRTIVAAIPQARDLCESVVKETRLAQALLAFVNDGRAAEFSQIAFQLTNLWPYRERPFASTVGFDEEIAEGRRYREEALRGVRLLARYGGETLAVEVSTCFTNIARHLAEEVALLEECHARIQPHATNMGLTRKRLNLLIAAIDARMPSSQEKKATLRAYSEAAALLRDWENGVPLDERGVEVLERCLEILEGADNVLLASLPPARAPEATVVAADGGFD
jgi:hypothetical protein